MSCKVPGINGYPTCTLTFLSFLKLLKEPEVSGYRGSHGGNVLLKETGQERGTGRGEFVMNEEGHFPAAHARLNDEGSRAIRVLSELLGTFWRCHGDLLICVSIPIELSE